MKWKIIFIPIFILILSLDIKSQSADYYFFQGLEYLNKSDYNKAKEYFHQCLKIDPKHGDTYYCLGYIKFDSNDIKGAIVDLTKAIDYKSDMICLAYCLRGKSKIRLEDTKGAISDFTKAIEIEPSFAESYFLRGLAKIKLGQLDSACLDLSIAEDLGHSEVKKFIRKYCN